MRAFADDYVPVSYRDLVTAFGRVQSIGAWARETGINRYVIAQRLAKGIDPEEALSVKKACELREAWEGANALPFDADAMCQAIVARCSPLTLETVGAILGLTRERVRQIEEVALRKFAIGLLEDEGIEREEVLDLLRTIQDMRDARAC